jgi:oxygen-independent coproporphyrinogen-3 oxidase
VNALIEEMARRADTLDGPLHTFYLGGGTPSMLSADQIAAIVQAAGRHLGFERGAELTMEAHPDTVSMSSLGEFRAAGLNRLSIGAESLDPAVLALAGRGHSVQRVAEVVSMAREVGFGNVSLDLMYGLPGQGLKSWLTTLDRLMDMQPDHVSLYPLSVEPGTVFARRERELPLPEDETVVEMYHVACRTLSEAGFEHYEVANWARPGRRSRHNLAYWRSCAFGAVGVGAHGYLHGRRYENMRGVKRYIEAIEAGREVSVSSEQIDPGTALDDYLMLGLRLLTDGIDLLDLEARFGRGVTGPVLQAASRFPRELHVGGGRIVLREEAVPIANEVWQAFIGLALKNETPPLDLVS